MIIKNKPFKIYANFIVIKGFNRSIISNIQNGNYFYIPNSLYNILINFEGLTIAEIYKKFTDDENQIIDSYFDFLVDNKIIFFTNNPNNFPKIQNKWSSASIITNAIIDISNLEVSINYIDVIHQLGMLGCQAIQIRCFEEVNISFLITLLSDANWEGFSDIQLILKYSDKYQEDSYNLFVNNPRLSIIYFHSSKISGSTTLTMNSLYSVSHSKFELKNSSHCGTISIFNFVNNIDMYTESINYNSCLNRKIGIDVNGDIKNCPSLNRSFGSVKNNKLIDIITLDEFQEVWNITKDLIETCNICEFRYMCSDCRANNDINDINLKKPSKCNYNPYISKWKGEEGYKTLAECGVISNENGFSIDHDKIAEINKELWGE